MAMDFKKTKQTRIKGIILAGGSGSRLFPVTRGVSKQLLPVYNKPMIYYPLSILMLAGIREILIITTPEDSFAFKRLLKDGKQFGVKIEYATQPSPDGLAQAFIIGEKFIGADAVCLILGDNLYHGQGLSTKLQSATRNIIECQGATIFGHRVRDPQRFGVLELDSDTNAISIEEKPVYPKSDVAITGLYFFDNDVIKIAKNVEKSMRGEFEITSILTDYLALNKLQVEMLGRGYTWLDTGTHESLMEASEFIRAIEKQEGYKVACLEEIGFNNGWISKEQILKSGTLMANNEYGRYLLAIAGDT